MRWVSCESTSVACYRYEPQTKRLFIRFHAGGEYVYQEVSQEIFDQFHSAKSKGRYHALIIKPFFTLDHQATRPVDAKRGRDPALPAGD